MRWRRPICSSRSSSPSREMLRHRLEHIYCSAFLSIICHFAYPVTWSCVQLFMVLGTVWTTYLLNLQCLVVCICCICTLEYLMQILWNCVPIIYQLQIHIILLFPNMWPNGWCICDQTIFKYVAKRCYICDQSDRKSGTILYQTMTMPNTILWRFKHDIYDDSKMMNSVATSLMTSPPRHLSTWHTAGYDQHKTTSVKKPDRHTTVMAPSISQADGRLWRKRIVTKSLTALTATSVSQANVKLWRQ
jgi:hypothetical protein